MCPRNLRCGSPRRASADNAREADSFRHFPPGSAPELSSWQRFRFTMCSMAQGRQRRATQRIVVPGFILMSLALIAVSACSRAPDTEPDTSHISVEVHQTRSNVAARQLTIGVTNESSQPIEITSARFLSEQFVAAAVWPKDTTTIGAGVTADLPVALPAANCAAETPSPTVELAFKPASENAEEPTTIRSVTVAPTDTLGQLEPLFLADCLVVAAEQVATIAANTAPRISTIQEQLVAELDLTVTPTGGPGSLTIVSARGTTLFSQVDPVSNLRSESRAVDATVSAQSGAQTVTLRLVPSRCDPHAVAEDKLGTVFPLKVSLKNESDPSGENQTGTMSVAASAEVRPRLYEFVERACAAQ
jgi:hypothetical protein